ncbi:MAG: CHAT domain-containing protein [Anaerolineae bacterium]|nr:CHAT domain-containing protein [Anaerolineae bacterium]
MTQETNTYTDLEIHISRQREEGYQVTITLSGEQEFTGYLAAGIAQHVPDIDPVVNGQRLFNALFADDVLRDAWNQALGKSSQRRIRLRIVPDAPELHALPWELLHDGDTFLAASMATPFSRYLDVPQRRGDLVTEHPIRILLVIANPTDLEEYNLLRLDVDAERANLMEALGDLVPQHIQVDCLDTGVTLTNLETRLRKGNAHVLHFVGHGTTSTRQGQTALYLQDKAGNTEVVTDTQLTDMLRRQAKPPHLIFLAACQTAKRSTTDAFTGLAPKLIQAGIPAVVAMQDRVTIAATRKLTPVFYEELAQHGEVDRALNAARSLLLTGQSPDVATPVLLMRLRDGKLWEPLWTKTNPYRGLAAFTEQDAEFFFGRQASIDELLAHLRSAPRFLVVIGPSGSGKSSVVQAGLTPALRKGDLPGSQDWRIVTFCPGSDPYASVDLSGFLKPDRSEKRQVIFIDQFEELFALCPETVQQRFLDDLLTLIESPSLVTVILTVRADFYGHLLRHTLGERIKEAQVNVLPMKPEDLRAAIVKPAWKAGLRFEAGLVETIIQDASASSHVLPLLQSALTQLWHKQVQGMLTHDAYKAIDGVAGAIGLWADNAYSDLTAQEQSLARCVLTRLVHYGEGDAADTRQRQALAALVTESGKEDALRRLIKKLADARLVVTGEGETVEIIHDALLREWPSLKKWIAEQREFYLWRQRLDVQLQTWQAQGQDEGALLRGALLAEAEGWVAGRGVDLNVSERHFIHAGLTLREQEQAARERRRRRLTLATVGMSVILLVLALLAWRQRNVALDAQAMAEVEAQYRATAQAEAVTEANRARNAETTAEARRQDAENAEATAQAEATRALNAEATAIAERNRAEARQLAAEAQNVWNQLAVSPDLLPRAVLLAVESIERYPGSVANQVLADSLLRLPAEVTSTTYTGAVYAIAFSPGGKRIATVGCVTLRGIGDCDEGIVRIWDVTTGEKMEMRHGGKVSPIILFSPDGQWVLSAGCDQWESSICVSGSARVWEAATGREKRRITHEGWGRAVAFSQDGRWGVSGSQDGWVRVWEIESIETGDVKWTQMTHKGGVNAVTFSPDGRWVAVAGCSEGKGYGYVCDSGLVLVLDKKTGSEVISPITHYDRITSVAFSPNGQLMAFGSDARKTMVWDMVNGREVYSMRETNPVNIVDFSLDNRWVLSEDGSMHVREALTGRAVATMTIPSDGLEVMAFSQDRQWIVSGSWEGKVQVWEVATGLEVARATHNCVKAVALSPDGRQIASAGCDRDEDGSWGSYSVRVWDVAATLDKDITDGREILRIAHEEWEPAPTVAFSADNRWIALAGCESVEQSGCISSTAQVWETTTGLEVMQMTLEGQIRAIAISPDGQWMITTRCGEWEDIGPTEFCHSSSIQVWDVATGGKIAQMTHRDQVSTVIFSPDGRRVVSVGPLKKTMQVWQTDTWGTVSPITMAYDSYLWDLAFSPDGQLVASGHQDGTVQVWDLSNGERKARMVHSGKVNAVTFSQDGQWVLSGSDDNTARVWDVKEEVEIGRITYAGAVRAVAFNPKKRWALVGGCNVEYDVGTSCSPVVWDVENKRVIARIMHETWVSAVAFSPDGQWGASLSVDGIVRIWNAETGDEIARITGGIAASIAFSPPDGQRLIVYNENDMVWLWLWQPEEMIRLACERLTRNLTHREWELYFGDLAKYDATCPKLPLDSITLTLPTLTTISPLPTPVSPLPTPISPIPTPIPTFISPFFLPLNLREK